MAVPNLGERLRRGRALLGRDVGVDTSGRLRIGVAQAFSHHVHVLTGVQEPRGVRVAKVVKADTSNSSFLDQLLELVIHEVRSKTHAIWSTKHKVGLLPPRGG